MNKVKSYWDDRFYVTAYELGRAGLTLAQAAKQLGVGPKRFGAWLERKPIFKDAWDRGRAAKPDGPEDGHKHFLDYCYRRLPARLRPVWDQIVGLDGEENGDALLEAVLENQGELAKQYLFLHALVSCNFNRSDACNRLGLPYSQVQSWVKCDPDFGDLVRFILHDAKKDFVEGAFLNLVRRGDSPATVHAAKTLLADRGYGTKVDVKHSGTLGHLHEKVDVDEAMLEDLDGDEAAALLAKVRERRLKLPPKEVDP